MNRWLTVLVFLECLGFTHAMAQTARHEKFGILSAPVVIPEVKVVTSDGRRATLRSLTNQKFVALHLMYSRCKSTCPIQGGLFSRLVQALPADAVLVSVSVDLHHDNGTRLSEWRSRYRADPRWFVVVPQTERDVRELLNGLDASFTPEDPHTNQVYILDDRSRLVYRTADFPSENELRDILVQVSGPNAGKIPKG